MWRLYLKDVPLFACLFFLPVAAQAACPTHSPNLTFSVQLNEQAISQKSGFSQNVGGHIKGASQIGLYPNVRNERNGCFYLDRIDIKITINAQIEISDRYPRGSCEYQVVQNHELKHRQVLMNFYSTIQNRYAAQIKTLIAQQNGFMNGNTSQAQNVLASASNALRTMINRDHSALQYTHVDDPRLVEQESRACHNW